MKSIILTVFVVATCSSVSASEPTAVPAAVKPVVAEPTSLSVVVTDAKANNVQTIVSSVPSFCDHADVSRMMMNTDIGKKLHLQQQEALRQAIAQMVAEGKIPAKQSQQPVATDQKPAQTVEAPAATPDVKAPQK